ncbi:heparan-alpha-glucosaminide N-acetyltransferase domain-containing protein [Aliiglaciecola sp. CAU 1673]|uniref:acyltransferase family protein n=1 Tax=Aliiglaciecola sp. CAU 1673 TaxID=3032595 RepID=UPI0023DA7CC1|nr:heparan-alpha-glucosaminide N-acetyltransferase domain-containing protein [Aliiglaciecola sp. CAU 1673]MDF2179875.1 heparan-alpha-glucosaminide N-acetyltransferase domain-containing protein [Aliiglaciecola sp. CAU 1673]
MARDLSLDAFRGLTLAAMILVNTPGSWVHVYPPLLHAKWHGLTPTDLVFPFFLFIVGAAIFHAFSRLPPGQVPLVKIAKRTLLLFAIGVFLNLFPFNQSPEDWRVMGVLQRIALCYGAVALMVCYFPKKALWPAAAVLLIAYQLLMLTQANPWSLEGNLVRELDLWLFGATHLYQGFGIAFDPEGLLSTLPAIVTTLLGYQVAAMLSRCQTSSTKIRYLLYWSALLVLLGLLWPSPVNKALWTPAYVLLSGGFACLLLAILEWLRESLGMVKAQQWMVIYGSNPLFIYVLSSLWVDCLIHLIKFDGTNAYRFGFNALGQIFSPINASLAFALTTVALFYVLSRWLYRRQIFIKL